MAWTLKPLPPREIIDIGSAPDDGTGDDLRTAFNKVNNNFGELYALGGIEDGIGFLELNDTPAEFVPLSLLMVNTSGTGIVFNSLSEDSDIVTEIIDGVIQWKLAEELVGTRQLSGTITVAGDFAVTGDSGFSGDVYVLGDLHVTGNTIVQDTYINVETLDTENVIKVTNTAPATSTVTGALQVTGGVGIQGATWIGGTVHSPRYETTTGFFWANGTPYLNSSSFGSFFDNALSSKTTSDLAEGNNLYYTNARARNAIGAGGSLSYNSTTGIISYTTPSTSGIVEGTNLYYTDERARSAISISATGLTYNASTGVIGVDQDVIATKSYVSSTLSSATSSSDSITEGSTNLYYTNARARAAISVSGSLAYDSSTGVISYTTPSTSGIAEGTNLYYTDARARAAITGGSGISYDSSTGTFTADTSVMATKTYVDSAAAAAAGSVAISNTDSLAEGSTNLYFTTARARNSISATGSLSYNSTTGVLSFTMPSLVTTNVTEGTNLYYTDTRARAAISVAGSGTYNSTTGVITVNGGVTSVNGQTGTVYVTLSDITGTAVDDLDMGGYKVTNVGTPISGTDAVNKSYVDSTVSSALVAGAGGGGLTIPPDFFKAFEVLADNVNDTGAGATTIIGDTRIYQLDFSVSGTTRIKRYFYPYATVNAAYTLANGRLKYQYASVLPGKTTPMYTNGGAAQFYTNGTTATIYSDTTIEWTDVGTNVFQVPFTTGVNSVRIVIIGDGVNPNTFSNFIIKAFMPATTEYSRQNIGGLTSKAITFNNTFESVQNITITLNFQGYAWVTNQTNVGATLNFSSANPDGVAYAAISGY